MNILTCLAAKSLVDMSEQMVLRLNLHYFMKQILTACVHFINCPVQDSVGWPMSDQDICISRYTVPEFICVLLGIHEPPIKKLQRIWGTKYLNSLNHNRLVLEISANLF